MARYELANEAIKIEVDNHGAELKSLVDIKTGTEYMWCGDAAYWGRTAPVLFPFVGLVNEGKFRAKGKEYSMGQHGFARDMDFEYLDGEGSDNELWFVLRSSEETLAKYPYDFELKIGYRVTGRSVKTIWSVTNPGKDPLDFSIGGHPAFNCPIAEGEDQNDYMIHFNTGKSLTTVLLDGGLATNETEEYSLDNGYLPISEHLFDKDALIMERQNITAVSLCRPNGKAYLTVTMDAPLFGVWSPVGKHAPFICIEPWYGRADRVGFNGEVSEREWNNTIESGVKWEVGYTVTV